VLVGTWIAGKRAKRLGYDDALFNSFVTWMLVGGFLGGHVLDELFYHWDEFLKRPYSLLLPWEGLSSFGGFIGPLGGILLWKRPALGPRAPRAALHLRARVLLRAHVEAQAPGRDVRRRDGVRVRAGSLRHGFSPRAGERRRRHAVRAPHAGAVVLHGALRVRH